MLSLDVDECALEPERCSFLEGGVCKNTQGSAECECKSGYQSQPNPAYRVNSTTPREQCVGK